MPTTQIRWQRLLNMDGLYISDRFARGPVFYPNDNNTRWLPFMSEMTQEQSSGEFKWAMFPGGCGFGLVSCGVWSRWGGMGCFSGFNTSGRILHVSAVYHFALLWHPVSFVPRLIDPTHVVATPPTHEMRHRNVTCFICATKTQHDIPYVNRHVGRNTSCHQPAHHHVLLQQLHG